MDFKDVRVVVAAESRVLEQAPEEPTHRDRFPDRIGERLNERAGVLQLTGDMRPSNRCAEAEVQVPSELTW